MLSSDVDAASTDLVSHEEARAAGEIMQALASASRVRILDRLRGSPCSVGDLAAAVGLEQSAVSNHLRLLRHLALVTGRRRGRRVIYSLHDDHVRELLAQMLEHVAHLPSADPRPSKPGPPPDAAGGLRS